MEDKIIKLLSERYFLKNEKKWEDIAVRISEIYPKMFEYIRDMKFIPSSPTIMNLNTKGERRGTLSSCFPMDIEDSIEGIMESMKEASIVTKMGGGVGYDWSSLRASNEQVKGIGAYSSGPLPFIQIFDAILDGIQQGGKRRGAGMSLLSIYHPDILKFIDAKKNLKKYNRSNFSIKIDNSFYRILKNNPTKVFKTRNITDGKEVELVDENGKEVTYKKLWHRIIESSWTCAEPGIFNEDIAKERCAVRNISDKVICNPCSEFTNIPYTSCNLGSFVLSKFIKDNKFDWESFKIAIQEATRYMNKIIDNNEFPLKKIKDITLGSRPIGIGFMGFAHLLYKLSIPYDSDDAKKLAEDISKYMTIVSMEKSCEKAEAKGKPYPFFDYKTFMDANDRFFKREKFMDIDLEELSKRIKKHGIYNSSFTSIAPTGSLSYLADTSSGIEPVFGLVYSRKIEKLNHEYETVYMADPVFNEYVEKYHKDKKEQIFKYISENSGSCQECPDLPKNVQRVFVVAADITPKWHLEILSAVANNVSLSVSKTINMPNSSTISDIEDVYLNAHEHGIIGVTVYRDGCREGILNHLEAGKKQEIIQRHETPKRPEELPCDIHEIKVDGEEYLALTGLLNGTVYEIFVTKNYKNIKLDGLKKGIIRKTAKSKYDLVLINGEEKTVIEDIGKMSKPLYSSLSRMISLTLRSGCPLQTIVEQLNKTEGFLEFHKVVSRVLKGYIKDGEEVMGGEVCQECGAKLRYYDGCIKCFSCGFSKCG